MIPMTDPTDPTTNLPDDGAERSAWLSEAVRHLVDLELEADYAYSHAPQWHYNRAVSWRDAQRYRVHFWLTAASL